jgi:hypothetical protein
MSSATQLLQLAATSGAIYCALAYVYAFVLRSRGDRRFHVASLLFTGMALASLAALASSVGQGASLFALGTGIVCLIASVGAQSFAAFRGRKGDRRGARAEDERATEETAKPKVRLVAEAGVKAA